MASKTENINGESLWAQIDARLSKSDKQSGERKDVIAERSYRWVVDAILPISMTIVAGIGVMLPESLTREARIALFTFALATILWSTTKLNAAYVALAVTIILVLSGGRPQEALFDSLATDVIWLMIGAFVPAQALGVKLLKDDGRDIERSGTGLKDLAKIDLSGRDERLDKVQIDVACNIKNILCGEKGVARVFGPQKGATDEQVEEMSDALDKYTEIIKRDTGKDVAEMPGGGASGGLGAGLHALLGAELHSRFDIVFKYFKLDEALEDADLVITAEGGINFQTPNGKIPSEVARRAKQRNLPVLAIAGSLNKGARDNYEIGIDAIFSILREPCTLDEAIENAPELLEKCAENVMRTIFVGKELGGKLPKAPNK